MLRWVVGGRFRCWYTGLLIGSSRRRLNGWFGGVVGRGFFSKGYLLLARLISGRGVRHFCARRWIGSSSSRSRTIDRLAEVVVCSVLSTASLLLVCLDVGSTMLRCWCMTWRIKRSRSRSKNDRFAWRRTCCNIGKTSMPPRALDWRLGGGDTGGGRDALATRNVVGTASTRADSGCPLALAM